MNSVLNDLRYGLRILLKKPGFTLIAILSLALGIGANTAIFSLVDAVMLKSLPVQEPQKLVLFGNGESTGMTNDFPAESTDLFSYPFYREVQQRNDSLSGVTAVLSLQWSVHGTVNTGSSSDEMERLDVQLVSGTYFSVLGVNPSYGRLFTDADDQTSGAHPVVVLSHDWWNGRFGGDRSVVGKTLTIEDVSYNIIGIAPPEFFGTTVGQSPHIWMPLAMGGKLPPAHWDHRTNKDFQSLFIIGRLKDGVTAQQASANVNLIFKQSLQERAGAQPSAKRLEDIQRAGIELTPVGRGLSEIRRQFSLSLKVLMGVVGLVLLIACANVANLLLAHGSARRREFAVRLAVGAGRARLVRQLFTESLLLSILGGLVGVALAWWGSRLLLVMASDGPEALPLDVTPNTRILGFSIAASFLCAIVFGTVPALRAARIEPNSSLKAGKGGALTTLRNPLGKGLVVLQVALSLMLLVGAGLFVRTLINLQSLPSGFNQADVTLFTIGTSGPGYKDDDPRLPAMLRDVEEKVKVLPGVQAASFSFFVFNQGQWSSAVYTRDLNPPEGQRQSTRSNVVGPEFFETMGIALVQGRGFGSQDTAKSQTVAVISEAMAQRFFPNGSPLGKRFGINGPGSDENFEVIGVVKDAKYGSLQEQIRPMAYYSHAQRPGPYGNFVVRFTGPSDSLIPQVRQTIKQVNPNLPIDEVVSLSDHIGRSLVQQKLVARLASFFGLLALMLACIGLYGVMSYAVARRTNEIGIRMALGARSTNVLWLVLREVLVLVGIGMVLGLVVSLLTTKTAEKLLFGLKPNDPLTIALAAFVLLIISLLAGYLPARRAARVEPMVALREE